MELLGMSLPSHSTGGLYTLLRVLTRHIVMWLALAQNAMWKAVTSTRHNFWMQRIFGEWYLTRRRQCYLRALLYHLAEPTQQLRHYHHHILRFLLEAVKCTVLALGHVENIKKTKELIRQFSRAHWYFSIWVGPFSRLIHSCAQLNFDLFIFLLKTWLF